MGFDSNQTAKTQKPIPPQGLQLAVCYSIINLGTHDEQFPGKPMVSSNKVHYSWELPSLPFIVFDEKKGPQPMALFQEYTVAAGDKAKLPKMLCSWGNMPAVTSISATLLKAFLGQSCMINVEHAASKTQKDSKTGFPMMYANVGLKGLSVMPRMAALPKPTGTINPTVFLDLDAFDWNVYLSIPEYLQKKIAESKEWAGILVKYPKPATTMAQDLGYANSNVAADGNVYNAQGQLVQPANQMAETASPVITGGNSGAPAF